MTEWSTSEAVDEEIPKVGSEDKDDNHNGKGKRKADDGKTPQWRNGQKKFCPRGSRFTTYTDLTDTVENVFLATQNTLPYK